MDATIANAKREQKVDFIYKNIKFPSRRVSKSEIRNLPDEHLDALCEKFIDSFKDYLEKPAVKLQKFFADCIDADGKESSYDGQYPTIEEFRKSLEDDGVKVVRIVPARGHHRCKYCGGIAEGSQKDILCDKCRETFGHYSYNEL